MNIELRPEFSSNNPDDIPCMAARGDYMESSLIDKNVHDVLQGVRDNENGYDPEKAQRTLHERLIRRGHYGPYEHPQAFFVAEGVSRVCMAQVTRHRHMSFDVQSMRYCNFEDSGIKVPPSMEEENIHEDLEYHWDCSLDMYNYFLEQGIPKEDARFALPVGTKVNMTFSANIRSLFHLIDMRHAGDAQWEARDFAEQVMEELEEWAPITMEMYKEYGKGDSKKAP